MTNTHRFELDIKKPTYPSLSVVNGDTANVFVVKITDDGKEVELSTTLHKVVAVFTRSDGQKYAQDADSGLSFNEYGEVTINVRPASFRTGKNRIVLQVYEREDSSATTYPLLCTTCEAEFMARSAALDDEAPDAPPQLPMLEELIAEARAVIASQSPFHVHADDPFWNDHHFQDYAREDGPDIKAAADAERIIVLHVLKNGKRYTAYEIAYDPDAEVVYFGSSGSSEINATAYVGAGYLVQIEGYLY